MRGEDEPLDIDSDANLMLEVRAGNDAAFNILMERWKNPLINYLYRSTSSVETAEDLAQMVFVRIYRAAERYEPRAKFSTYLFHIARHLLINEFRRQARKPADVVDPETFAQHSTGQNDLSTLELEDAFMQAIEDMPENHRTAILLLKQQELSYEEIAAVMDASESAVKTWIFRARQHLKDKLKGLL